MINSRKFFQILSLILIALDLLSSIILESLDISFTLKTDDDYNCKLTIFIIKV